MTFASAIYEGNVIHERLRPKHHRLRYKIFSLLLDLDELPDLDRGLRWFGYNKPALLAFHDRDHGPTTGSALRPWVEERLREAGLEPDGGSIRLLCCPRVLGYVFNPLSVFFCFDQGGQLAALLYEVCNTFQERHTYVIPVAGENGPVIRQSCEKKLYVSPFIDMACTYHFRIVPPGNNLKVVIRQEDDEGLMLAAAFKADRVALSDGALARRLLRFPLVTVKIIAGIHWEAAKMWLKGFRVFPHDKAPEKVGQTIVT